MIKVCYSIHFDYSLWGAIIVSKCNITDHRLTGHQFRSVYLVPSLWVNVVSPTLVILIIVYHWIYVCGVNIHGCHVYVVFIARSHEFCPLQHVLPSILLFYQKFCLRCFYIASWYLFDNHYELHFLSVTCPSSTKKVHHSCIIDLVNLIGGGFDILKVASDILC